MGAKIKINIPPEHSRFRKGESGNPSGRRKRSQLETIPEAVQRKLMEPVIDTSRRKRTNRHELAARRLVAQAVNGNSRAITEIGKQRKLAARYTPKVRKVSFEDAQKWAKAPKLDDAFYEKQARDKAEFKRKAAENATLADYVEKELRKRVKMDVDGKGKMVRMSMQDVIVHNLTNDYAKGELAAIALVEKLVPKRQGMSPPPFTEVAKPTAEERAAKEEADRANFEWWRKFYKEESPGKDWDNDDVLRAEIADTEARVRR